MTDYYIKAPASGPICDFCSSTAVVRRYKTISFSADRLNKLTSEIMGTSFGYQSDGDWAACQACADLIDNNKWDTLAHRSERTFFRRHPEAKGLFSKKQFRGWVLALHDEFRRAKL